MVDEKGEVSPALGISLNAQFAAGRQLVFQTHVDRDTPAEAIRRLVAKINDVIDAEEAFYALPEMEKAIEVNNNQLFVTTQRIGEIDAKMGGTTERGRSRQLNPKEAADRENMVRSKERFMELLQKDEERLAELRKKAGNRDGSSSTTDR